MCGVSLCWNPIFYEADTITRVQRYLRKYLKGNDVLFYLFLRLLDKLLKESGADLIEPFYLYCLTTANMHIDLGWRIIQNMIIIIIINNHFCLLFPSLLQKMIMKTFYRNNFNFAHATILFSLF